MDTMLNNNKTVVMAGMMLARQRGWRHHPYHPNNEMLFGSELTCCLRDWTKGRSLQIMNI